MGAWNLSTRAIPSTVAVWRDRAAETERGRLALWLPAFMGAGVALYFSLTWEPPFWLGAALILPAGTGAWLARRHGPLRALALLLAALGLGFSSIQFATWRAPPVEPLPTPAVVVSGVVIQVELLPEGAERVTLTQPRLHPGMPPLARDLRIRLRADDPLRPRAGDRIEVRALLRAPQLPLFPGARDMQRDAFFHGLAGGGMALNPARRLEAADVASGASHAIQRLRGAIVERFAAGLPGAGGAIGSALFTGQTAAIPRDDVAAFRNSGLAHLLAVSGLHVGIVIGLVFALVRLLLALSEYAALHWPCKQIAALAGLAAAVLYTPLAGAQVPLLRSVAMASLIVLGIVVGRRALTLRGLALAAASVLLLVPQELPGPSLQMSFAAVLALIAGHEALRPLTLSWRAEGGWWRRRLLGVGALVATSLLAGSATAAFGLYHFGRVQLYFVLANLVAGPLTGLWVMPWGLWVWR